MNLKDIVNTRFLQAVELLIKDSKVKSNRSFCQSLNIAESTYGDIKSGRRSVTIEILEGICDKYGVSYLWMLGKSDTFYASTADVNYERRDKGDYKLENKKENLLLKEPLENSYNKDSDKNVLVIEEGQELSAIEKSTVSKSKISLPWMGAGEFFLFRMKGDSMLNTLSQGDKLTGKLVYSSSQKSAESNALKKGQIYLVILPDNWIVGRFAKETKNILFFSQDNNALYPEESEITRSAVKAVFEILEYSSTDFTKFLKDQETIKLYKSLLKEKGIDI